MVKKKTTRGSTAKPKPKKVDAPVDYSKPLKNSKHEAFCQQYIIDNNATQAAIRAGYSEKTAGHKASALVVNSCIAGRLVYLQGELAETCGVTAQMLLDELKKIGFGNIKNVVKSGNTIKDISQLPNDITASIDSISSTTGAKGRKTTKVTLHSKISAIQDMGKMIGAYAKDNEQRRDLTLADIAAMAGVIRANG